MCCKINKMDFSDTEKQIFFEEVDGNALTTPLY